MWRFVVQEAGRSKLQVIADYLHNVWPSRTNSNLTAVTTKIKRNPRLLKWNSRRFLPFSISVRFKRQRGRRESFEFRQQCATNAIWSFTNRFVVSLQNARCP